MAKNKPDRDFLQRGPTHEIDEAAQRIFRSLLPTSWVINELKTDYGKDYHVEITEQDSGKVTGRVFYVQLKGTDGAVYRNGRTHIVQKMTLRHLSYYRYEVRFPLFLFVVDIKTRKAYWLFLQEYLINRTDWQNKKKPTLHIPTANELMNPSIFESEVDRAITYMRSVSISTRERVDFDIAQLEAKDPRFKVYPEITRDITAYRFQPLQNIRLGLHFKGSDPSLSDRVNTLIKKGEPVHFGPGEIEVKGSALFEALNESGGVFRIASKVAVTLKLTCCDENRQNATSHSLEVPGCIEGGLEERFITSNLPQAPYTFTLGPIRDNKGNARFCPDETVWDGQPLLFASYFEPTFEFFQAVMDHQYLNFECLWQGNVIWRAFVSMGDMGGFGVFMDFMHIMNKARYVARHFHLNPLCRTDNLWRSETVSDIETLYDIICSGRHMLNGTHCDITVTGSNSEVAKAIASGTLSHDLVLYTDDDFTLPFLGQQVPVGSLAIEISKATMKLSAEEVNNLIRTATEDITLSYGCSEESECLMRQLTEAEKDRHKDKK